MIVEKLFLYHTFIQEMKMWLKKTRELQINRKIDEDEGKFGKSTERCGIHIYICILYIFQVFEKPLIESLVLSIDEIERIFINWRDIIACNDNFLR